MLFLAREHFGTKHFHITELAAPSIHTDGMTSLVADAPAPVEVSARTATRLYALDNLRSLIIVLVVVFHASMSYMMFAPSWWYVVDTKQSLGFFCFVMICDVFMMPAMFLLAGYFALPSLLRQGQDAFIREKAKRVGIPWVVGTLFLAPVTTYFIWLSRTRRRRPTCTSGRTHSSASTSSRRSSGFSACCCCSTSA